MPVVETDANFRARQTKANDYLIDRQLQKTESFTGIRGVRVQDMAVQEDQRGPLSDRAREHLGASDLGVIATRRLLLKQLKALQKGQEPRAAAHARGVPPALAGAERSARDGVAGPDARAHATRRGSPDVRFPAQ